MLRAIFATLTFGTLAACGQSNAHPKPLDFNCDSGNCVSNGGGGGGGGTDSGSGGSGATGATDGAAGSAGDAASDGPAGTSASGKVQLYNGDNFASAVAYSSPATIGMDGATGTTVTGNYDGTSFTVQGVASGPSIWASVIPQGVNELTTLQTVDTQAGGNLTLSIVAKATLQIIGASLSTPTSPQAGTAQVVVQFVDSTGAPVPKATLTHQGEKVAYDLGASWSDQSAGTGAQGYAVMMNVTASATAAKQTFNYATTTKSGGVDLMVIGDGVTFVVLTVAP